MSEEVKLLTPIISAVVAVVFSFVFVLPLIARFHCWIMPKIGMEFDPKSGEWVPTEALLKKLGKREK